MAKIIYPSYTRVSPPPSPPTLPTPPFTNKAIQKSFEALRSVKGFLPVYTRPTPQAKGKVRNEEIQAQSPRVNEIMIMDYDFDKNLGDGSDSLNTRYITLPTVPRDLEFEPKPEWAVIASIGRNSPFLHFTGAEDTLSFTIDWYSKQDNREDVIFCCRWLEAKTKANGYKQDPHRIMVKWGTEDRLFRDTLWVVTKATYKLSQFQKHRAMLPQQAYQDITLKRVADYNLTTDAVYGDFGNKPTSNPDRSLKAKGI